MTPTPNPTAAEEVKPIAGYNRALTVVRAAIEAALGGEGE